MTLEVLQKEMIAAMKDKNKIRKDTISSMIGAIKKTAIDKKCKDNITEELVNEVILKEKKTMQEMIDTCPSGREDTLKEYTDKMIIINEFAPQLIVNEDVISDLIDEIGLELTKANRGVIMKELKSKNVDMKIANKILSGIIQ